MKIKSILISLLIAVSTCLWCGCSDDIDLGVNDAKLEKVEGFRISKFTTDRLNWGIENDANLHIVFHSHADDSLYEFSLTVDRSGDKPVYAIHIPENQTIPDGEYDALAFLSNGRAISPRMKFKIIKEIVKEILERQGYFNLRGHGTQDKPYVIGSKEEFNEFEAGLILDGNSKGFGLFFEQTASFDAPPRSSIITGTYHAGEEFAGNYYGNGFSINVPFTGNTTDTYDTEVGLFKELVGGAAVRYLTINVQFQGVHTNGGAVAGKSSGKVLIDSVNVEGSINAQNLHNIGGFIGSATGELTISNSSMTAYVAGEDNIGGAVGCFETGTLTISNFRNAKVDRNKKGDETVSYLPFSVMATTNNAGGLVGKVSDNATISISNVTMVRSVQAEDGDLKAVTAPNENAGGLIGGLFSFKSCKLSNVSLNFPVYGKTSTGGLIGYTNMTGDMTIDNCRFMSVVNGENAVGGIFGSIYGHGHKLTVNGSDNAAGVRQDVALVKVTGVTNVGGFAGIFKELELSGKKIYINTPVIASKANAGGAIGMTENTTVNLSQFNISEYTRTTCPENVGGMVGSATNCTLKGDLKISDLNEYSSIPKAESFTPTCSAFAGISTSAKNVGGIVGYIKNTFVSNLCFGGTVEGTCNVGGIIGLADNIDKGYVRGCVNRSPKIDNKFLEATGGIIGRLNQFKCDKCENLINYGEISGCNYTGGVIGDIHEEGKAEDFNLKNVVNVGNVTGTGQVGGCVGHYWASGDEAIHTFTYCANYGTVKGSGSGGNVGGVIGYFNARKAVVKSSANHGIISASGDDVKVGGIGGRMGTNEGDGTCVSNNMELAYSCNFGEVSSSEKNANVGGLLGWQEQGSPNDETHYMLHNCYNMGTVPSDQNADNGGVLGCIDHQGEVQNCFNAGMVTSGNGIIGTHKSGSIIFHHNLYVLEGTGKYWCADKFKEEDKSKSTTYKGFDFTNTWVMDSDKNNGFPHLKDCPFQFKKLSN